MILEDVQNLCTALWIAADHSLLKYSQNTHRNLKPSKINALKSITLSCVTHQIFVFKFFSLNTKNPIKVLYFFTVAQHTKTKQQQRERRIPPISFQINYISPCIAHEDII